MIQDLLICRYSTVTNDQMNLLLMKISNMQSVHVLDVMGLKIENRRLLTADPEKYLNFLQSNSIFLNHISKDQATRFDRKHFHFTRNIYEVLMSSLSLFLYNTKNF